MACENVEGRPWAWSSTGLLTISKLVLNLVARQPFLLPGLVLMTGMEALALGDLRALTFVDRPPGLGEGTVGRFGKAVNILGQTRPL